MKKIFATLLLCVMTLAVSAEVKSIDVKGNLRNTVGIGGGMSVGMSQYLDFCPSFNYYFSDPSLFTIDADFHYNIDIDDDWAVYPLFGGSFLFENKDNDIDNSKATAAVGLNFGAGCQYKIIDNIAVFTELKWQGMTKEKSNICFTIGFHLDI